MKRRRAAFGLTTLITLGAGILLFQPTSIGGRPLAAHPLLHLEQKRGAATLQSRLPPYGGYADYGETDEEDPRPSPPPPQRRRKKKKSAMQSLAEQSLKLTTKTALGTVKQSGKAAYYLVKPKHVEKQELVGLWRLDQQVQQRHDDPVPIECSANIELTRTSVLVTIASADDNEKDKILETPWNFKPARWPRAARVEFAARAFAGASTRGPQLFFYKGQVDRKLADRSVIKIKGKIYRIEKTGWRGKTVRHVAVGTFVARRRLQLLQEDDDEEDVADDEESAWESDEEDVEDSDEVPGRGEEEEEELSDESVPEDEEENEWE